MNDECILPVFEQRISVRAFQDRPIEPEKLQRCLEAARLAPSACNSQPWTFIVVDEPELKHNLAQATTDRGLPLNHFTLQAPVHVVIVMEGGNLSSRTGGLIKRRDFRWIDIGIAAEHFCLQAVAEGLGTCMLGWFHERKVQKLLSIPRHKAVALIITLGYPSESKPRPRKRKPLTEMIRSNRY